MNPRKLDYHSPNPQNIRRPGELALAIIGFSIFTLPCLASVALLVCWDANWNADLGVRVPVLLVAIAMAFGVWEFTSRIWKLCRRTA
jgi:uncharacterized membrane protein YqjE